MYLCVRYIDVASFHECTLGYWNCSDNVSLFVYHFTIPWSHYSPISDLKPNLTSKLDCVHTSSELNAYLYFRIQTSRGACLISDLKHRIYPIGLGIKDTTYTDRTASYLDLHLEIDNEGRIRTKLYDKKDDFNFPIVNFPFTCSNIPAAPAYGVYISQLIRYSRASGSYQDFLDRGLLLTRKLLNQGFLLVKLKLSLQKFYGSPQ